MALWRRAGDGPPEERSLAPHFLVLAGLTLGATAWVFYDELETRRPWKQVQRRFNDLQAARGAQAAPVRIRQTTNPELKVVDRCQTCHLGVNQPGLTAASVPAEFRTHPRRKALLGKGHRPDRVGCTPCHHGQGSQTKGIGRAPFDHGRNDPYWERPMLRGAYVESTCVTCHTEDRDVPGARRYNAGRRLFAEQRCHGCHATRRGDPGYPGGPSLEHLRQKTSRALVERWLRDPRAMRPHTRMPEYWPAGGDRERRDEEVKDITAYLGSLKPTVTLPDGPAPVVDATRARQGAVLFDKIGCRGCHTLKAGEEPSSDEALHGPELARTGDKASARWLDAWLAGPRLLWQEARMPDLRLTDRERGALVSLLAGHERKLPRRVQPWPPSALASIQRGEALVSRYMCAGCHQLPGKKAGPPPGPSLADFGDTPASRLEWGDARGRVRCGDLSPQECWTEVKIRQPRRFSGARIPLSMPDHRLTRRQARDLSVFVLSNRRNLAPPAWRRKRPEQDRVRQEAERHMARLNCRTCHEIGRAPLPDVDEDGEFTGLWKQVPIGGQIRRHYASAALAPPTLDQAGEKFQYPWLFDYLKQPTQVRPWLTARMPTFDDVDDRGREVMVRYLAQRSGRPYPFARVDLAPVPAKDRDDSAWLFTKMQCYKCHQISSMAGIVQADLAPDLALGHRRLQPGWVARWLLDPQALSPGTRMPAYFPLEDDEDPTSHTTPFTGRLGGSVKRQVDALVRLSMRFGMDPGLEVLARMPEQGATKE